MKYFLDTEFIETGRRNPITLISIGIVAADGREFYAVSSEFNPDDANDWVKANVLPQIRMDCRTSVAAIQKYLLEFIGNDKPEFWGYYADYDWVVLCQIFGAMINLPEHWPMYCNDIKQFAMNVGNPKLPKQESVEHNALADARWNKVAYEFLDKYSVASGAFQIAAERQRQINEEGWTAEHDDIHSECQLLDAALCYAGVAGSEILQDASVEEARKGMLQGWPWAEKWWKPSTDPIRNLVKAGALIAAEIDRLKRALKNAGM